MDLAKLNELAQKATPGPCLDPGASFHDARYIAAAHPQTVLELIAEVERLREASYRLREEIRWLRKGAE